MQRAMNKLRSQQTYSNVMNGVFLPVANITPMVTPLLKAKQYQDALKLVMFISPVRKKNFYLKIL